MDQKGVKSPLDYLTMDPDPGLQIYYIDISELAVSCHRTHYSKIPSVFYY